MSFSSTFAYAALCLILLHGGEARLSVKSEVAANPIRKVVNLMQKMAAKVQKAAEAEEDLYKKFECYCKKQTKSLETAISVAEGIGPITPEDIAAKKNEIAAIKDEVKKMKADKVEDENSLAAAKVNRGKEHDVYEKVVTEEKETENAAESALGALGVSTTEKPKPAFLQVDSVSHSGLGAGVGTKWMPKLLRGFEHSKKVGIMEKRKVAAFLQGKGDGADSTDVRTFIIDIEHEAEDDIVEEDKEEGVEVVDYKGVKKSKKAEIAALLNQLENKMRAISELEIEVVNMQHNMENGAEALAHNKKMLAEVKKGCDKKAAEWEERKKYRADEQVALQDAIKMLTSDDALELFKKTIKGPSLMQLSAGKSQALNQVKAIVNSLRAKQTKHRPTLNFLALKLSGKKVDYSTVFKKIDEMIALMKKEQQDDDSKKDYCIKEFKGADKTAKEVNASIVQLDANLEASKVEIEKLEEEVTSLKAGIKDLDDSISEASENRKEENAEFEELVAGDTAAVKLIGMAKDRLAHFYTPSVAPNTATTTPDPYALSFVEISEHHQQQQPVEKIEVATPPPTFGGEVKAQESDGILHMMDTLIGDLEKEMTIAKTEEKNSQADYEETVAEAKTKRQSDMKSITGLARSKSDFEADLLSTGDAKDAKKTELEENKKFVFDLHGQCDFLLENFEFRKQARIEETEGMTKAKQVLAGADLDAMAR